MKKSNISPSIIQDLFESASNAAAKGQAQWFTPKRWASTLAEPLADFRPTIADLACGNSQLLFSARGDGKGGNSVMFGCDIQPMEHKPPVNFAAADITKFFPLLRAVRWSCDIFTLNPPWDLHWYRKRLAGLAESDCAAAAEAFLEHDGRTAHDAIDSTIATICMALDRLAFYGEGYCISNESTLKRLIFAPDAPHKALKDHIWAHVSIDGNICETKPKSNDGPLASGVATASRFRTGIIYFARQKQSGCYEADCQTFQDLEAVCRHLKSERLLLRRGAGPASYNWCTDAKAQWYAAKEEYDRLNRKGRPLYNISLDPYSGRIRTFLSLFDDASGRIDKKLAAALFELNGKQPIQLVVQRAQRKALEWGHWINAARGKKNQSAFPCSRFFERLISASEVGLKSVIWRTILPGQNGRFGRAFDKNFKSTRRIRARVPYISTMKLHAGSFQPRHIQFRAAPVKIVHGDDFRLRKCLP